MLLADVFYSEQITGKRIWPTLAGFSPSKSSPEHDAASGSPHTTKISPNGVLRRNTMSSAIHYSSSSDEEQVQTSKSRLSFRAGQDQHKKTVVALFSSSSDDDAPPGVPSRAALPPKPPQMSDDAALRQMTVAKDSSFSSGTEGTEEDLLLGMLRNQKQEQEQSPRSWRLVQQVFGEPTVSFKVHVFCISRSTARLTGGW
jgi:hypothetical protein